MSKLFLSHWETDEHVYVNGENVENLRKCHITAIRSLYQNYSQGFKGKLLSFNNIINPATIIQSFLSALKVKTEFPILIICDDEQVRRWHYEMNKLCTVKLFPNDSFVEKDQAVVVICSFENLKAFQTFCDVEFSFVIVDDIDMVVNKRPFKKIGGNFRIGLTRKGYVLENNTKLLWYILNWTNPHLFGKLTNFAKFVQSHCNHLRDPFDEVWHRIDWDVSDDMLVELGSEEKEYNKLLEKWASDNSTNFTPAANACKGPSKSRKRKRHNGNNDDVTDQFSNIENMETLAILVPSKSKITSINVSKSTEVTSDTPKSRNKSQKRAHSFTESNLNKTSFSRKSKSFGELELLRYFEDDSVEEFMKNVIIPEENWTAGNTNCVNVDSELPHSSLNTCKEDVSAEDRISKNKECESLFNLNDDSSEFDDNPILSAIIDGSPIRKAVDKEMSSIFRKATSSINCCKNLTAKFSLEENLFEDQIQNTKVLSDSNNTSSFLKSAFGDDAAIIDTDVTCSSHKPSEILTNFNSSTYVRVRNIDEINKYTSSHEFLRLSQERKDDNFGKILSNKCGELNKDEFSVSQDSDFIASLFGTQLIY